MQLTMLGVGSSAGTPMLGCKCATCASADPRNNRTRCSSVIQLENALREGLTHIDAVLYTHTHADHLHGIDDLRGFCQIQRSQLPLYGSHEAMLHIADKFGYTLREPNNFWDLPVLKVNPISLPFQLFGQTIIPIPLKHGNIEIYGYRIGDIAYLTDVSSIPENSLALLQGLKILLLDCLRYRTHYTHINLEQSLHYASLIKAESTYLIHMTHELEYASVSAQLPSNIYVGYDGLKLFAG
jgi:phosphoribosyl 1,2-cyclic phosphate phosphodiesterase